MFQFFRVQITTSDRKFYRTRSLSLNDLGGNVEKDLKSLQHVNLCHDVIHFNRLI